MSGIHNTPHGLQRRLEVLDAALKVIARDGIRAVTHRSVAAELGSSVRATTYYFASIDELIEAAFVHYVSRSLERFAEVEQWLPTGPLSVDEAARALAVIVIGDLDADRDGLVAEYSVVLEIARRPALESIYADWQAALERLLVRYGEALGAPFAQRKARITLATLRGLELEALSRPNQPVDAEEIEAIFAELLSGLTANMNVKE